MTANQLIIKFRTEFEYLEEDGLEIRAVVQKEPHSEGDGLHIDVGMHVEPDDEVQPDHCYISLRHPFLFDNRKLPEDFMGCKIVNAILISTSPPEINEVVFDPNGEECNWTPDQIKNYVVDNKELIRLALKAPNMTVAEMLDAICFGDFKKYETDYNNRWLKRLFP
jgi:hypothetical protein